jgi:hypothetical protein
MCERYIERKAVSPVCLKCLHDFALKIPLKIPACGAGKYPLAEHHAEPFH